MRPYKKCLWKKKTQDITCSCCRCITGIDNMTSLKITAEAGIWARWETSFIAVLFNSSSSCHLSKFNKSKKKESLSSIIRLGWHSFLTLEPEDAEKTMTTASKSRFINVFWHSPTLDTVCRSTKNLKHSTATAIDSLVIGFCYV